MSILWMSDTPSRQSGFGITTKNLVPRLISLGRKLTVLGWWCDHTQPFNEIPVIPFPISPDDAATAIIDRLTTERPDWVITLGDIPWVAYMANHQVQTALKRAGTRWILYCPIDGALADGTLPSDWVGILHKADAVVVISEFARATAARSGIAAKVIPHGVDVDLFRPPEAKQLAKRRFGYDGKFVILSDMRNHRRKLLPRALDIVKELAEQRDRIMFHIHTNLTLEEDTESYRYDLEADLELMGLWTITRITNSDTPGLKDARMAELYAAADVHLLTSWGEGFGLPTIQAAGSGVVPIAPANSASSELVSDHGFAIRCGLSAGDEFGLVRGYIDRSETVEALKSLHDNPGLLEEKSRSARRFAVDYSWDNIARDWDDVLAGGAGWRRKGQVADLDAANDIPALVAAAASAVHAVPVPVRPTGHSVALLPVPRIGIPTRLNSFSADEEPHQRLIVYAGHSCLDELKILEKIFPGLHVLELPALPKETFYMEARSIVKHAVLVVIATAEPPSEVDLACALENVSFLGTSRMWPPPGGNDLVREARLLLTDFALSESRLALAKSRVAQRLNPQTSSSRAFSGLTG